MVTPGQLDLVNGAFELVGAGFNAWNCRRLWIDWRLAGYDWRATAFFTAWGFWNLLYYPSLDQWFSFAGGVAIVAANSLWIAMALMVVRGAAHPRYHARVWRNRWRR